MPKDERAEKVQSLSIRNQESMERTLDFVANEVSRGRMTPKQGDVVNTTAKTAINAQKLRLGYLRFYFEVYKKEGMASDQVLKKADNLMPRFFFEGKRQIEQAE